MARLVAFPLGIAALIGCDAFKGVTEPLVSQGIILGVEAPQSDQIDLSGTDFQQGTAASIFLADATSVDDLSNAPIEGATVDIRGPGDMGNVDVPDAGDGLYAVLPTDQTLDYQGNADWTIVAQRDPKSDPGKATIHLPPPADLDIPEQHDQGQPMQLDLSGKGFTSVLVAVIDVESGTVTFDNEPKDIKAIYDMTRGSEEVGDFEIPGTAFPDDQKVYAVGVAGMQHTKAEDLDGLNTLLTSFMAGDMNLYPTTTGTIPTP